MFHCQWYCVNMSLCCLHNSSAVLSLFVFVVYSCWRPSLIIYDVVCSVYNKILFCKRININKRCASSVLGFKGALYRGFFSLADATAWWDSDAN